MLRISRACGVKEVRRLRFLEGSVPINSVRFCIPERWRASASAIQRSSTGLIFWALFGVMSNFSNLAGYKRPGFSLPVRLLAIVFSWASCGRKKWLLRMVCLGENWERTSLLKCPDRVRGFLSDPVAQKKGSLGSGHQWDRVFRGFYPMASAVACWEMI